MSANTVSVSSSIDVVSLSAIENAVSVAFGDRPKALEDGTQGDHTVAYALYQKWLVKSIEESVASCGGDYSNPEWIRSFVKKMQKKLMEEEDFLTNLGLNNALAQTTVGNNFSKFLTAALNLEGDYTNDADIKNLLAYKERVNRDTQVPEEFVGTYGGNLIVYKQEQSAFLDKLIMQRKIALGAKVAESAAVAFLQIKNASAMVSFKQVPGRAVDKGQGGRINGALNALSNYRSGDWNSIAPKNQEEVEEKLPVTHQQIEGKRVRKPVEKFGASTAQQLKAAFEAENKEKISNALAGHIITLLDFKKLSDEEIKAVEAMHKDEKVKKKLPESRLRTNEKKVLHFTIASLLATTFQVFPELEKDEAIKKLTVKAVIAGLLSPEYAGKNNAMWDKSDISDKDMDKILELLDSTVLAAEAVPFDVARGSQKEEFLVLPGDNVTQPYQQQLGSNESSTPWQNKEPRKANAFETAGWINNAESFSTLHMDDNLLHSPTTPPPRRLPLQPRSGGGTLPPRTGGPPSPMIISQGLYKTPTSEGPMAPPSRLPPPLPPHPSVSMFDTPPNRPPPPPPSRLPPPSPEQPPKGGGPRFGSSSNT